MPERAFVVAAVVHLLGGIVAEAVYAKDEKHHAAENLQPKLIGRIGDEILFLHTNDYLTGSRLQNSKKSCSVTEGGLAINNIMLVAGLKPLLKVNSYHSLNAIFSRKKSSALEFIDPELHNVI